MRTQRTFAVSLIVFVLLYLCYGLKRFTLGIDFTDEGGYIAWPMRMLFGERIFESESATLLRPLIGYLSYLFRLHPSMTLYEFRMLGWCIHLVAFVILAIFLFRLSNAPIQSPLIASVPLFVCHILSVGSPSYNSLASDFLLIALSLRGLGVGEKGRWETALNIASGLALFLATTAHAALGVVAAVILTHELLRHDLAQNLVRRKLAPSNTGVLVFVACWLVFLLYLIGSGGHIDWLHRTTLFRSLTVNPLYNHSIILVARVVSYPFRYSDLGILFFLSAFVAAGVLGFFCRTKRTEPASVAAATLAFLLIVSLICTFSYEVIFLSTCFAMVCLVLIAIHCLGLVTLSAPISPEVRFLIMISGVAGLLLTASTFYFSPHRSWISGILALPFTFSVGLTLLLRAQKDRSTELLRVLTMAALFLAVACVAREHYRSIHRDAPSADLVATFRVPKFRHIYSTAERTQVIDALYDHLHPKLSRGEPFLAFDECPLLYYLFDAKPSYGLTWATRYTQNPNSLRELDREFKAKPLPRYAIRALVDVSDKVWRTSTRIGYDDYPLNETVLANYDLERTIFPFEIWRLKSIAP